ncbi:MAG TPA: hypothetical protein VNS46_18235 [Nocardioides sp.]|nr:hypothetical protein [Nocardioides sp.]
MTADSGDGRQSGNPRWRTYRRPIADEVEREGVDARGRPLRDAGPSSAASPSRRPRWVLPAALVATALGTGGTVFALTSGEDAPSPYPREQSYRPILTDEGLAAVTTALEARTGGTEVLDLWMEGDDAIRFSVPPEQPGELAVLWRWDGSALEQWSAEAAGDRVAFDLAAIDPAVLVHLDEEARSRSDGRISASRAHVERPMTDTDHWIHLHVDEVDHGAVTLWADLRGDVESELVNESWRDD